MSAVGRGGDRRAGNRAADVSCMKSRYEHRVASGDPHVHWNLDVFERLWREERADWGGQNGCANAWVGRGWHGGNVVRMLRVGDCFFFAAGHRAKPRIGVVIRSAVLDCVRDGRCRANQRRAGKAASGMPEEPDACAIDARTPRSVGEQRIEHA